MTRRGQTALLALSILILTACEKDQDKLEILEPPQATQLSPTEIEVSWETNFPSTSTVYFGLTDTLGDTAVDEEERQLHVVTLTELKPDTVYYYQVESSSEHFSGKPKSDLDQFETAANEESYALRGWELFGTGQYGDALTAFTNASNMNPSYGMAYVGRGWVYIRLEVMETALEAFDQGLVLNDTLLLGYAGRAVVNLSQQDYSSAIDDALEVLETDSTFTFQYDGSINHVLVRLILAEAYYATQQYALAQEQCDRVDPNNGLDPILPSTWIVNGSSYDSYIQALLALVQSLVSQHG